MSKALKLLSLFLVSIMILSTITACGSTNSADKGAEPATTAASTSAGTGTEPEPEPDQNALPIVEKPITLKYWMPLIGAPVLTDMKESKAMQELMKRTNINLEFIHAVQGLDSLNLMLASGEYPDLLMTWGNVLYPGGNDKAIADGVFVKLNDLIDEHAPNYKKARELSPEIAKQTITDSGNIYAFSMLETDVQTAYRGPMIRKDWLDELNLPVPTTIDEWYTCLKAFKDKGVEAPMMLSENTGVDGDDCWLSAFGVARKFFKVDEVVKFGPIEPGYKQYLETFAKWYKEGLIDKDFPTQGNTPAYVTSGRTGALKSGFWNIDPWKAASDDPNFNMVVAQYPSLNKGEPVHLRQWNQHNRGYETSITTSNKYPVESVKLFNYIYSDEGTILMNYGIENESYKMVDGKPVFTEIMTKNPEGKSFGDMQKIYANQSGSYIRYWKEQLFGNSDAALAHIDVWSANGDFSYNMPPVSMTAEEGKKYTAIMADIETLVSEMTVKIIMGIEPVEKYDSVVEQIKKMNIDEAIKLQQDALDRYNARK